MINENRVTISGCINSILEFSHEMYGEKFYKTELVCKRKSGISDRIRLLVSDHIINTKSEYVGEYVEVVGEFRSFNERIKGKSKLQLFVFVQGMRFYAEEDELIPGEDKNEIRLEGYITKPPVLRVTPLGREIADVLIAVNRGYGHSSYIPCICWSRNAKFADTLPVGAHVVIEGRVQSREYTKKLSDTAVEQRTAYEVSISWIKLEGRE